MFKKTHLAAAAVSCLLIGSLVISVANETPRIMVLHSYSTSYVWTNLVNQSLKSAYEKSKFDVQIRYFYMNTRDLEYRENAPAIEKNFVDTVRAFKPRVIIAVDDAAQRIISRHYLNHPDIDIVFAGVNYSVEDYDYAQADNITGIFEHKPVTALKKIIDQLDQFQEADAAQTSARSASSIAFFADDSTSSHNNAAFLSKQDWGDIDYRGARHVDTFDAWQQLIIDESGDYDYILVSGYRQLLDRGGVRVDSERVANWTQVNSRAALIGMNVFNSEDGVLLSVGVSPHEQGALAYRMALGIIRGDAPADMPYREPQRYIIALSENALFDPEVKQAYKTALLERASMGVDAAQ
ncbi:MAG: hypothetical protein OXU71_10065 [Gammaproteobacteria bacterium]|nr:hypothetical protein [Gammaproteobacteria bacterium]MDD9855945.1 hypothetical protein [Gammaproteobacteria bacterium]